MRKRNQHAQAGILILLTVVAWSLLEGTPPANGKGADESAKQPLSPVFTPAHPTVLDALRDFFNRRPEPVQPIAYTHKVHLANGMQCTDCHVGVDEGPEARIPGVNVCMTCHSVIATDKPEIKKIAAYAGRGEDIPWQRVYGFSPSAHVKFNHAPHIWAGVQCSKCHGDMTRQTVAVRSVDLTMGFCVQCHREKKASIDCITCHY
jgi:hypothetical protein